MFLIQCQRLTIADDNKYGRQYKASRLTTVRTKNKRDMDTAYK